MKHLTELVQYAIDSLNNKRGLDSYGCDLHNELFNTDYYISDDNKSEQWLIKNVGIFPAINEIKEYEQFNFGSVNTDLSCASNIVNMFVYIKGEEILSDCQTLNENWDYRLDQEMIDSIIEELKDML